MSLLPPISSHLLKELDHPPTPMLIVVGMMMMLLVSFIISSPLSPNLSQQCFAKSIPNPSFPHKASRPLPRFFNVYSCRQKKPKVGKTQKLDQKSQKRQHTASHATARRQKVYRTAGGLTKNGTNQESSWPTLPSREFNMKEDAFIQQ